MKLFNSLTNQLQEIEIDGDTVGIYSCGPTVYNHVHIGNLVSFIVADTLRRTLKASGTSVKHVMNLTDVDDKTIKAAESESALDDPMAALTQITRRYENIFNRDMRAVGCNLDDIIFVRATENIDSMKKLISDLHEAGIAYIADDGVYFSIEKYKSKGRKYGQLVNITEASTGAARVDNDEYDKDHIHDFALWKKQKEGEPAWEFELGGKTLDGRPGWHLECSAMSVKELGQPFAIHTGGTDLKFPHHENEIAQSTATGSEQLAACFVHNEHLLVEGKKMSKSLGNFFVLEDIKKRGFDPLAFRLMALQGHYRRQTNFSWSNLTSATNWLNNFRNLAEMRWQPIKTASENRSDMIEEATQAILEAMQDDLNTPKALATISQLAESLDGGINDSEIDALNKALRLIDALFGISVLETTPDIDEETKDLINQRLKARNDKDFDKADQLRRQLETMSVAVKDTPEGCLWHRTSYKST